MKHVNSEPQNPPIKQHKNNIPQPIAKPYFFKDRKFKGKKRIVNQMRSKEIVTIVV